MLAEPTHEVAWTGTAACRQQQMYVIGHQDVGVNMAGVCSCVLAQQSKVDEIVGRAGKAGSAIVPALDDVKRHRGQDQAFMS
ncbi:conserved hypothetical protein [Ricinus communis]|uniref:Uncharacterized protein n=1 Tax=Ricinus communis TaxID=3988 RepID=B9TC90_RICCO|nr:conserved hypothetical protein [Ricinus communis]